MQATDLIYLRNSKKYEAAKKELSDAFPDAIIQDASDELHPHRFEVSINTSQDDLYLWLLACGFLEVSLGLGLMRRCNPKKFRALLIDAVSALGLRKVPPNQNHP